MKIFKCYSSKLAGYLRQNGFEIIGKEVNLKKPQFDVFLFEDTEELRRLMAEYSKAKKEKH